MQNKHDLFSVVTITFNNFSELKATLESLPKDPKIESVVINGGSCVLTKAYLENNKIKGVSEKDEGISDAFNKGLLYSSGDYIVFLNSGDLLIDSEYYLRAAEVFKNNSEIDFVYSDIIFKHSIHGDLLVKPSSRPGKTPYPHPSLVVRKKIYEKLGGFDKTLKVAMDFDFIQRMTKSGCRGHYDTVGAVVIMDGTGASSHNGLRGIKERELILKRYDLLTPQAEAYFKKLILKTKVRDQLQKLRLLKIYDICKGYLFSAKSE